MKIPTETERAHLYTQLASALDPRSAEFIVGLFPSDQDDRLATRKDLQILKGELMAEINDKIDALSTRMTGLLIAVLMVVIGAMTAVYFAP